MDMGLAVCHRVLRYLSGERYQPLRVALPHSPVAPLNVYKRFFHAEVMIDQNMQLSISTKIVEYYFR